MNLKRLFLLVLCTAGLALHAEAQSTHSATYTGLSITAGAFGSGFQPDYLGLNSSSPYTPTTGPNRLYGFGTYVDVRINRWVQIEAEGRWQNFNKYNGVSENNYLIGPRVRFTPYGKFLVGASTLPHAIVGAATTWAYGGGVDYRLSKHFIARPFDIEYQNWNVGGMNGTLKPYGVNVGIAYKIR